MIVYIMAACNIVYYMHPFCIIELHIVLQETYMYNGENFRRSVCISRTKASWIAKLCRWVWTCPDFVEKTFTDGSQTAKFMKIFSLESFPLYGTESAWMSVASPKDIHNPLKCVAPFDVSCSI